MTPWTMAVAKVSKGHTSCHTNGEHSYAGVEIGALLNAHRARRESDQPNWIQATPARARAAHASPVVTTAPATEPAPRETAPPCSPGLLPAGSGHASPTPPGGSHPAVSSGCHRVCCCPSDRALVARSGGHIQIGELTRGWAPVLESKHAGLAEVVHMQKLAQR